MLSIYAQQAMLWGKAVGVINAVAETLTLGVADYRLTRLIEDATGDQLQGSLESIPLPGVREQIARVGKLLARPDKTLAEVQQAAIELGHRLEDALGEQHFLHVPPHLAHLYLNACAIWSGSGRGISINGGGY